MSRKNVEQSREALCQQGQFIEVMYMEWKWMIIIGAVIFVLLVAYMLLKESDHIDAEYEFVHQLHKEAQAEHEQLHRHHKK